MMINRKDTHRYKRILVQNHTDNLPNISSGTTTNKVLNYVSLSFLISHFRCLFSSIDTDNPNS